MASGALPAGVPSERAQIGLVAVYTGLAVLLLGWVWYGRSGGTVRQAYGTLAWWAAPLLAAPPLFSRDVYSYLAQGLMIDAGLDVYRHGPATLGGLLAAQVPAIWQHTASPYGPTFMVVARAVTQLVDTALTAGVLAMRLVALGGLGLLAAAVPVLARAAGVDEVAALWLATLNPLVLIHLVGGAHNDALMVGLLAAGLAAAVRHRPLVGTVLVTAAALVKAPAAVGLVAVAAIWTAQLPGRWRRIRAACAVGTAAGAVTVLITRFAGTGTGGSPRCPHRSHRRTGRSPGCSAAGPPTCSRTTTWVLSWPYRCGGGPECWPR
jgi:alpha-1,6-mannosyltransferase